MAIGPKCRLLRDTGFLPFGASAPYPRAMKPIYGLLCSLVFACGPTSSDPQEGLASDASTARPDANNNMGSDAAACLSATQSAEQQVRPVDILWVVDTSGSMDDEANEVQSALNDFSSFIAASGIDYHVVLIADSSMNVPPPLGGSAEFLHVQQAVGSTDALEMVFQSYAAYSSFLRPGASVHIVVVTDDESDWSHAHFNTKLAELGSAELSGFVLHSICSEEEVLIPANPPLPALMGPCNGGLGAGGNTAAEFGETYIEMSAATGGLWSSICSTDWNPIFDSLAAAVSEAIPLACTYQIPLPEGGEVLDPQRVNFVFHSSAGGTETISQVSGLAACGGNGGWYYDLPSSPTQILVCPTTCSELESDAEGEVEIQFGCATIVD